MKIKFSILIVLFLVFLGCNSAEKSRTVAVKDGQVVILKSGSNVALLRVSNQKNNPEVMDFESRWRTDGEATISMNEKGTLAKKQEKTAKIEFGPFVIGWSVEGSGGMGWLYLEKFPGGVAKPENIKILVTDHNEFDQITISEITSVK